MNKHKKRQFRLSFSLFLIYHQMTSPIKVLQVRSFSLVYAERNQMNREWKIYVMQLK